MIRTAHFPSMEILRKNTTTRALVKISYSMLIGILCALILVGFPGCGMSPDSAYKSLVNHSKEVIALGGLEELLDWDLEVMMPPEGAQGHSRMIGIVAGLAAEKESDPQVGEWLEAARKKNWPLVERANLREWKRDYDMARKLPPEFVKKQADLVSRAYDVWLKAREKNDFGVFAPMMEKLVSMARQEADYLGWKEEPYDALLDTFEPGLTTRECEKLLMQLRDELVPIVKNIVSGQVEKQDIFQGKSFPEDQQAAFDRQVSAALCFDYNAGRMDKSEHPFSAEISKGDSRLTTRYYTNDPTESLSALIHETGHGLYFQGVSRDGTPAGQTSESLALNESQSRLYENQVGRCAQFWQYWYPDFQAAYGVDAGMNEFLGWYNRVEPGLVRRDADEVTYNLHILIRFEIERDLLRGKLKVADIPRVWREKYKKYLGVDVPDDLNGALQDVHWGNGYFGYFPTYTLGNIYAAQLFDALKREVPGVEASMASGDFKPINDWMKKKIYKWGRVYPPEKLIEKATGSPVSSDYFINYLKGKYLNRQSIAN